MLLLLPLALDGSEEGEVAEGEEEEVVEDVDANVLVLALLSSLVVE